MGPSFDALAARYARFIVGLEISRKCNNTNSSDGGHRAFFESVRRSSTRRGCVLYFDRGYDLEAVARKMGFDFLATSKKGYHANPDVPITYELPANTSAENGSPPPRRWRSAPWERRPSDG